MGKEPAPLAVARPWDVETTPGSASLRFLLAAAAALFLVLVLEHLLWMIAYPLALIFGGIVIAQGIAPLVEWPARFLPRPIAVVAVYLVLLAAIGLGIWFFVPTLIAQANALATELPDLEFALRGLVDRWSPVGLERIAATAQGYLVEFSGILLTLPVTLVTAGANLVLVFFLSLYWLSTQPRLRGWVLSLIPDEHRDKTRDVLTEVGQTVGGYVRGVVIDALVIGALTYVGLVLLGMPLPLVLAVLAGIGEFIPVLGPFLAAIPALGVALATGVVDPLLVLVFYVGLQQVESNILVPLIMRGQAHIPPLLSLMAFLVGAAVGGVIGALIAIPLCGALRVIAVRLLVPVERDLAGVSAAEAATVRSEEEHRDGDDPAPATAEPAQPRHGQAP
jgi:predicted PurR-regulated permease PerM